MKKEIKELLEGIRHEFKHLTSFDPCGRPYPEKTLRLDYTKYVEQIDSLFAKYADKQAGTKPTMNLGKLTYASYESEKGNECRDMVKQLQLAGYDDSYISVAIRECWCPNILR